MNPSPSIREIAKGWLELLKSTPGADHWVIEDGFVERLAATWPWVRVYFELLPMTNEEEAPWAITLGIDALQETLGLRLDYAAALFSLLHVSRLAGKVPPEKLEKATKAYGKAIDQLARQENEREEEWRRWFREAMGEGGKGDS